MTTSIQDEFAPGVTVEVRDEQWLVTKSTRVSDGWRLQVRGASKFVRDQPAVFFTALEDSIKKFDPADVTVKPDQSPRFRHSRLWLESTLRSTPVPLHDEHLEVARDMLLDPLDYQLNAVRTALDPERTRPRVLLADAVGLGKTLEIGMILAELIRRGRGERILVVTPNQVLEQFQQELWTRFAIPLIRLDSRGVQKVRQKLPASRNPFSYFPRVIVSIDTLKQKKHLTDLSKVRWDAVVIDEVHNATNAKTANNELARILAPRTDALILASATPHNGKEESFRELLRLLDPLAVRPDGTIDAERARELIIRRHRNTPEVSSVVGEKWAKRPAPVNRLVEPSAEETAVAKEISGTWIAREATSRGAHLFAWTLVKAFLSSPAALAETIEGRIKREEAKAEQDRAVITDLQHLGKLNAQVTPKKSAKFQELLAYLKKIGVGKGKPTRVVIFSERVATLYWLQAELTKATKMTKGAVRVMHGGLSDVEQLELIDEFKRENTPIRILVTGDVASEGVNLHAQCHHLIHYDIPWSLIRIQQRNGRIDRYGQRTEPQIATILLDTEAAGADVGEVSVLTRLVERENEANKLLGDTASLMGKHSVTAEEDAIREVLAGAKDFDETVAAPEDVRAAGAAQQDADGESFSVDNFLAGLGAGEEDAGESDAPAPHGIALPQRARVPRGRVG